MQKRYLKTPGKMNPSPMGHKMLTLKVGESMTVPWEQCPTGRPSGPGQAGVNEMIFDMEPTDEGLKITRAK